MKKPQTREQADALLKRQGQIHIALGQIEARLNLRLQQAKEAAREAAGPLAQEEAAIRAALQAYFLAAREQLDGRRSLQLTFGRLGLRARSAVRLQPGWSVERALAALEAQGLDEFVRLRRSLNREAVRQAPPEQRARLRGCGLALQTRDTFFCEPELAALAPGGDSAPSRHRPRNANTGRSGLAPNGKPPCLPLARAGTQAAVTSR